MESTKLIELIQETPIWYKSAVAFWLICGAILLCYLIFKTPKQSEGNNQNQKEQTKISAHSTSEITIHEIIETVRKAPPLQQNEIANHYLGLNVDWTGYLRSAEPNPTERTTIRVNLNANKDEIIGNSIWFNIKLNDLPELKILHKKSTIRVKGKITKISIPGLSVELIPTETLVMEHFKSN